MALDATKNFAKVEVSIGYNDTDTSIVLTTGDGSKLPDPASGEFNLVWWNYSTYPDPADDPNVEIVRCTAKSTDTLTVTRGQEGTAASTKNTASKTYKMGLSFTKKMLDDIETVMDKNTDIADYADSPMIITGGEISKGTTGTYTVSALTALLRNTNSLTGELTYVS
ncbi:MAG: hypothetical protein ACTSQA_01350, partial [Candidatus Heimdallarchaeaceae archaeon]